MTEMRSAPSAAAAASAASTASAMPHGDVTLVEGSSFCVSTRAGDMIAKRAHGLFFQDTRIVSSWQLLLDDAPLESLAVVPDEPFSATFVCRAAPRAGLHDTTLVVERRRMIADGLREDVVVRNHGTEPAGLRLALTVDADFTDLFDVKEGRARPELHVASEHSEDQLAFVVGAGPTARGVRVRGEGATAAPGVLFWRVVIPPQGEWRTSIEVLPQIGGDEVTAPFPLGVPVEESAPSQRMQDWRAVTPTVSCDDPVLEAALRRSALDLGALRIEDPSCPGLPVVAAGAPWFMALFGRDALLTSWMALPFDPSLAVGTLHTLARYQGRRVDALSEEEPGRILHEVRLGIDPSRALGGSRVYYGTVDATPLFVMLLDEAARWGVPLDTVRSLLPAADRALAWVQEYGDSDGDGFVDYRRKSDRGLLNQGWKDSYDGVLHADGRPAAAPIALAEVQAYVYGAFRARAHLASVLGDEPTRRRWVDEAERLRCAFNERFWMADAGAYALALDGDGRHVGALTSNQGHCLWTGIADEDKAKAVADQLTDPSLFSGWGVRTLASSMRAFNPVSYHNGSVWPHDNALIVAGLARYGFLDAARTVATAIVEVAGRFGGRLPELFCGFSRSHVGVPVPYPTSCSPQSWAAATPVAMLRALLRLSPCVPHRRLALAPALPRSWGHVRLAGVPLGDFVVEVDTAADVAVRATARDGVDPSVLDVVDVLDCC